MEPTQEQSANPLSIRIIYSFLGARVSRYSLYRWNAVEIPHRVWQHMLEGETNFWCMASAFVFRR
jgi:hypothetical protein